MTMQAQYEQRAQAPVSQAPQRLYFVDYVRVALTMLVIVHHLAITYSLVAPWYYVEPPNSEVVSLVLGLLVLLNQGFFMGTFFLIAGYLTPGSFERKGARAFMRDRLMRLGIPILLFVFVLGPLAMLPAFAYTNSVAVAGEEVPYWQFYLVSIGPGPLWFLEALLVFALLYVLWRAVTRGNQLPAATTSQRQLLSSGTPSIGAVALFMLLLGLVTFVWRLWVPIGSNIPIVAFPTPSHLPQYISLFVVGIVAYHRNWLLTLPNRMGRMGFVAAALATLGMLATAVINFEVFLTSFMGGLSTISFVYAMWEAIFCVGMAMGILTLFRQRFNRDSALGGFLATHAYAVYIIHAPLIVAVAYYMAQWQLPSLLKFVVACVISIPLCFGVAYLIRKVPFARQVI